MVDLMIQPLHQIPRNFDLIDVCNNLKTIIIRINEKV